MRKVSVVTTEKEKFTPVFSETFIEFQMKDLEFRTHELEFKKIQSENNFEYAKNTLRLQSEDLKNMREHEIKREKNNQNITLIVILLFFTIIMIAMLMNKDEILIELGKIAGYVFGGGLTGYGLALHKSKTEQRQIKPS